MAKATTEKVDPRLLRPGDVVRVDDNGSTYDEVVRYVEVVVHLGNGRAAVTRAAADAFMTRVLEPDTTTELAAVLAAQGEVPTRIAEAMAALSKDEDNVLVVEQILAGLPVDNVLSIIMAKRMREGKTDQSCTQAVVDQVPKEVISAALDVQDHVQAVVDAADIGALSSSQIEELSAAIPDSDA